MTALCNLDGVVLDEAAARIPVLDRGFLFGDSIYEVIRTRGGHLFAWREHLDRLRASAAAILLELDLDDAEIVRRVLETVDRAGNADSYVRIVVTRGTGSAPNIDLGAAGGPVRWVVLVRPLPAATRTARLQVIDRLRNDRRALDPATKSGNYLNNVLGLAEARARGATDCVFLNAQGHATEASTSNLFVRLGGEVVTPPLDAGILAGITRALVVDLLRRRGDAVVERHLTAAALAAADELWLTSTLRDVTPVTHLDGRELPPAPFAAALATEFAAWADRRARDEDAPAARRLVGAPG